MTRDRRLTPWRVYRDAEPTWSLLFVGMATVCWLLVWIDIAAWRNPVEDTVVAVLLSALIWREAELACTREELRLNKIRGAQWPAI